MRSTGTAAIVAPVGELDLATVSVLEDQIAHQLRAGVSRLVIDLRGLSFIGCSGLELLTRATRRARDDGTDLSIIGSPSVQHVMQVTGLARALNVVSERQFAASGSGGERL